jgi:hypothetical protein
MPSQPKSEQGSTVTSGYRVTLQKRPDPHSAPIAGLRSSAFRSHPQAGTNCLADGTEAVGCWARN